MAGGVWSLAMKRTTITAVRRDVHRLLEAVRRQLPAPRRAGERRSVWCGAAPGWDHVADRGYKAVRRPSLHLARRSELSGAVALPAAQATAKTPVQSTSRSYGSPY